MDKYTVDLDQVLNDFEYSELTDQHSFEHQNKSKHSYPNNFKNTTNVKHSINNVFHSLNEYLNTEITPAKCEIPASHSNGEHSIPISELSESNNNNTNDITSQSEPHEPEIRKPSPPASPPPCPAPETQPITSPQLEEVPEQPNNESITITEELVTLEPDNDETAVEEKAPIVEEEVTSFETTKTDIACDKNEESESSIETIADETELKNVEEIPLATPPAPPPPVQTIGFDDDLNLDESELNRYLEELEKEYETEQDQKTPEIPAENPREEPATESIHEPEPTIRPNNLDLVKNQDNDESSSNKTVVINLVGDPGSTPYNNVYISKELPQKQQQQKAHKTGENSSDTECSTTSASPTFSDISTETTSSCTPSTDTVNDEVAPAPPPPQETSPAPVQVTETEEEAIGEPDESNPNPTSSETVEENPGIAGWIGKRAPIWIPDADAPACMHCEQKFTVIKRRHHCRACGYVLCSKCCGLKHHLEYLEEVARVCNRCYDILTNDDEDAQAAPPPPGSGFSPNPNNPLEYCSTVPPHQQVTGGANPPSVLVPVGVLKRQGSNKVRTNKSVMFCDGIRPGSDLTNLDNDFSYKQTKRLEREKESSKQQAKEVQQVERAGSVVASLKVYPSYNNETKSFMPNSDEALPPIATFNKTECSYSDCLNTTSLTEQLRLEAISFALQINLIVHVKIINMECCINKTAWCFSTQGLINVGQDEIVLLIELLDDETLLPRDIFLHLNNIYLDAVKGTSVKEMGLSLHNTSNFLGSKNHAGFVYIRPTFQCIQNIIKPSEPYLIGILIHRWETPWAKLFPLRLVLRLGAEYRYYPSPIISNRYRDSVFVEIGHTIINLLADFRNYSYTLPQIRGLTIHMEEKNTTVTIPRNRYDQVMKSMNNSSDHILAFAGNFSSQADSHLVCIQDTQSTENAYSTHAINIHNKPRKVTGASFIVFNGALKSSSGLTAKSSIVEDGLMIQIPSEQMTIIRDSLRNMKDHTIQCGCINATSDESVNIVWGDADVNFNLNVVSPIDSKSMEGIPSIRVHNGKDYVSGSRLIRWTEVFIVEDESEGSRNQDPIDISKISETIAKATCAALVKYLDLLVSNNFHKIGIRAHLNAFFVAYTAGSNSTKLPPIYMESLDNELVPILHRHANNDCDENKIVLELVFRILNK